MSLIDKINTADIDVSRMRFDKVSVRASFAGYEEKELPKATKNGATHIVSLKWTLKEALPATDGRTLAPGKGITDRQFVNAEDGEDVGKVFGRVKRALLAARGLPMNTPGEVKPEEADIGREVVVKLSYQPGKDDPSDPEQGFQNFAYYTPKAEG